MKSGSGDYKTQSLFLEHQYDTDHAVYSLKAEDYEFKGVLYPSLKKIYLAMEDLGEYEFACTALCGWKQWVRITNNKVFTKLIQEWRDELEVKLRGKAIAAIAGRIGDPRSGMQAEKWMAEGGWKAKKAGRPSNADVEHETKKMMDIAEEYKADVVRLTP